jgi:hypothetical protein
MTQIRIDVPMTKNNSSTIVLPSLIEIVSTKDDALCFYVFSLRECVQNQLSRLLRPLIALFRVL